MKLHSTIDVMGDGRRKTSDLKSQFSRLTSSKVIGQGRSL
jgi:hypothetical protein